MNEIGNVDVDENLLWRHCFPHTLADLAARGVYVVKSADYVLSLLCAGASLGDDLEEAVARLELACSNLWPDVCGHFRCDFFPHLLACATDILHAVDFGELYPDHIRRALVAELVDALDALERQLAGSGQTALSLRAAEQTRTGDEM